LRPTKILVVGLQTHDAGKTTLCKALIHGSKAFDVNLVPFKPHSGIGYWSQFNAFQDSLLRGVLLSSDIMELEDAAHYGLPLELLNPVNRLSSPTLQREATEEKLDLREFIAERLTHHDGRNCRNVYYLNGTINTSRMRGISSWPSRATLTR
jgi:predicted P-loop ATPase/GTPase